MNRKLTFPELAELLSEATNTSKRMSELVLREVFAVVTQSLVDGESVKIKDLGVFKVTGVSPRKSVDVNTGNTIEIPGHNKVTFTPDKRLAEAVNASFASFEAVVLEDDVTAEMLSDIDAESEVESVAADTEGIAAEQTAELPQEQQPEETGQTDDAQPAIDVAAESEEQQPEAATEEIVEQPADAEAEEEPEICPPPFTVGLVPESAVADEEKEDAPAEETEMPVAEEPVEDAPVEEAAAEETETPATAPEENAAQPEEPQPLADKPVEEKVEEKAPKKVADDEEYEEYYYEEVEDETWWGNHKVLKGFIFGALFGFGMSALMYFCGRSVLNGSAYDAVCGMFAGSEPVENADTVVVDADTAKIAALEKAKAEEKQRRDSIARQNAEVQAEKPAVEVLDTISKSNFLTRMSRRHYGNSHFWVYIYEENKSKIDNPNNVRIGTVVVIPDAKKYGIDKDNEESVKKAIKKEGEIQSKYQ